MAEEQKAAKLQVLTLPSQTLGEVTQYPFALILSEVPEEPTEDQAEVWAQFKDHCGAVALLVTPYPIEVL